MAKGDYFIILDSDCILPKEYLTQVSNSLDSAYVYCFGGPDQALESFSAIQKAINFSMTSFLTTGGIRGGSEQVTKFQPRSFNMGLSKQAFEASNGFGNIPQRPTQIAHGAGAVGSGVGIWGIFSKVKPLMTFLSQLSGCP